ncbi:hypothetical protein VMUT_0342 [Vulcanisaeta moutnovskia 768-28]|uniref:Uncharacterized protein n=1 Tax=Vulcanisaeta moutnovskia (strain 768-28) TaxID=985053 RepID=F0QTT9_VULM7|nr:hypothetical protein [Vulcanisaeta moutnovskia]ADY00555.1 hypothetical protein VMUT_0342 [Vulcanisaeta moutnovskia 768-28]
MARDNPEKETEEVYSRTTIMVPKNIASELSRVAKTRGRTLFYIAGEGLKLTTELIRDGFEPSDLIYFWRLYKILSSMDVIPMPMKLIEEVCGHIMSVLIDFSKSDKISGELREGASKAMNDLWSIYEKYGHQVGALVRMEFENLEELLEAISRISRLLAVRHIEVKKLSPNTIELMAIGPSGTTDIGNKALLSFIRGFVAQYDYEVVSEEAKANVLRVVLQKKV